MEAFLLEWLSLIGRWVHLITGIAWIGASFYFVWLDNHLLSPADQRAAQAGVGGELWAVHGGGFYHAQKYRVAPVALPGTLHWFYWEAYSTWLSGFFLLCLLYYGQAEIYLIDAQVAALSKPAAIAIGIAFLAGSWLIYDALCRSPLGKDDRKLGPVLAILLATEAYALCHLFSGRGAFIQFGAALGTIMVANVFFVIIPGQRELVKAKRENREPDPIHGVRGKQRSVHNTYFTLPVLFSMISNHYGFAYQHEHNWLVLVVVMLAGALIRHFFVARHRARVQGARAPWGAALAGVVLLAGVAAWLAPRSAMTAAADAAAPGYAEVRAVIDQRCVMCHNAELQNKNVALHTRELLARHAQAVYQQTVAQRTMPLNNATGMTDEERALIARWFNEGAPVK